MPTNNDISYSTHAQTPIPSEGFAALQRSWPKFIQNSIPALRHLPNRHGRFAEFFVYGTDRKTRATVGYGTSFPLFCDVAAGRFPRTWDESLGWSVRDAEMGILPNALCILDIVVNPAFRREGIASAIFEKLKAIARQRRMNHILIHVRPLNSIGAEYGEDDFKRDPWVAYHLRSGARKLLISENSMTIEGSAAQWENWTGIRIQGPGAYDVGGIVPMMFDDSLGEGIYREPNVLVHYEVSA